MTLRTNGICTTQNLKWRMKHKLLWDYEIQIDHLISSKLADKKRTCRIVDFAVPEDYRLKLKESKKRDKYHDLARQLKKTVQHKSDLYSTCNWCSWYSHQRIVIRARGPEITGRIETVQTTAFL